jgi:hypothetical protein
VNCATRGKREVACCYENFKNVDYPGRFVGQPTNILGVYSSFTFTFIGLATEEYICALYSSISRNLKKQRNIFCSASRENIYIYNNRKSLIPLPTYSDRHRRKQRRYGAVASCCPSAYLPPL